MQINSFIERPSRREEVEIPHTGGETLFVAPGVELFLRRLEKMDDGARVKV